MVEGNTHGSMCRETEVGGQNLSSLPSNFIALQTDSLSVKHWETHTMASLSEQLCLDDPVSGFQR